LLEVLVVVLVAMTQVDKLELVVLELRVKDLLVEMET
jgi:hypothetical protein